jgi:glycosyltransferase involved in cell wall biosynthesis
VLDIALEGETSLLFEKKNAADLAAKIKSLIDDPEKRKKFSMAARQRVLQNFNIEYVTDKITGVYKNLVS